MSKKKETLDKNKHGNDFIADVSNSALDWWYNLPFSRYNGKDQYTYATKHGYGDREVDDISDEEILNMYKKEHYS